MRPRSHTLSVPYDDRAGVGVDVFLRGIEPHVFVGLDFHILKGLAGVEVHDLTLTQAAILRDTLIELLESRTWTRREGARANGSTPTME